MSTMPDASTALTFRPATSDDWPRIAPWIGKTWEWGDYINAYQWMKWSGKQTDAHLIVVEQEDQIVGFSRLIKLGEAEWWLEGVRVAPDHRGHGVGKAMLNHMIGLFNQVGNGILRFYTGSKNEPMQAVARDLGFIHRMSYTQMSAQADQIDFRNFKVLAPQNQEMVWQYLRYSPMYRSNHFVDRNWCAYFLTRDRLGEYLSDQKAQVLGWRQFDQLHGVTILVPNEGEEGNPLTVGYIDAPDDTTLQTMMEALRGLATQRGHNRVLWKLPTGVGLERPVERSAYVREWEGSLWLYELPLRSSSQFDVQI